MAAAVPEEVKIYTREEFVRTINALPLPPVQNEEKLAKVKINPENYRFINYLSQTCQDRLNPDMINGTIFRVGKRKIAIAGAIRDGRLLAFAVFTEDVPSKFMEKEHLSLLGMGPNDKSIAITLICSIEKGWGRKVVDAVASYGRMTNAKVLVVSHPIASAREFYRKLKFIENKTIQSWYDLWFRPL